MEHQVQHTDTSTKGSYFIEEGGTKIAEMTYSKVGTDRIIIDHTEVDERFKGKGLGELMVRKSVGDARDKKISIVPLCPFARAIFNKNDELKDVL
ncbi:MAG: GNAT family N-acetyltransferase [Ekhidna sp.]